MKTNFIEHAALLPLLSTLIFQPSTASAQGTAFTYQGQLNSSGSPASGLYDFRFRLDADPAGNTILATVLTNGVSVSNGLFTTTIDFGAGFFNGSNYWLEVDVTTNIPSGYTQLNPFQPFTPAPYAVFASTAGNVTGAIALTQLPAAVLTNNETGVTVSGTVSGTFSGDGGGLTNLNAAQLAESGTQNVFIGSAGSSTTIIGFNNVAIGDSAFLHNSGGALDTAVGAGALESNTFGQQNAAYGAAALQNNTSGIENTASGVDALQMNQAGNFNTAYGFQALLDGTSGSANTAVGMGALEWGTVSQPGGPGGTNNIAVGYQAGSNYTGIESSNIVIGNVGVKGENNTIRIGSSQAQTFIAGVINGNGGGLTSVPAANLTGALPAISGANLTSLNASAISSGTIPLARLPALNLVNVSGALPSSTSYTVSGNQTGGINSAVALVVNNNTSSSDAPALRVIGNGVLNSGALSVSSQNPQLTGLIAQFGNSNAFVVSITNDGTIYCKATVLSSDRNLKEHFKALDVRSVLDKLAAMPVTEWNYKDDAADRKHIGPVAQDFYAAFGLDGKDDKRISTVDEGGVALAAIQGLNQKVDEKDARIQEQADEIAGLKQSVAELKQLVQALAQKK